MNTLQCLVWPNLAFDAPEDLYLRLEGGAWVDLAHGALHLPDGATAHTDTFFNGLTVDVWKREADIADLLLGLRGQGRLVVTVGLHRLGRALRWVTEQTVDLDGVDDDEAEVPAGNRPERPVARPVARLVERPAEHANTHPAERSAEIPIDRWGELDSGLLYFRVRALGAAVLTGAEWTTRRAPPNAVRLGIVITHFNRSAQVLPAIRRIREALLDRPGLRGRLTLTVVDNSNNLALEAHPAITHLPNRNLGGTGGFVRGLLSLIDRGDHTHALFMDDDASCEPESIARTLRLLQHARNPRLAVAGSLLREAAPWLLLEKGARFTERVLPIHAGLDMRSVHDLLVAEKRIAAPDYGAWWFFAFPIAAVRAWPFPFFVRGDDIHFGLANRFEIATLNGVGCLGDDFGAKHGPLTAYLDARYHLVHALIAGTWGGRTRVTWIGRRLFVKALSCYLYGSARAVTTAIEHVLQGPGFFREQIDLQTVRAEIASWSADERLAPIDRTALTLRPARAPRERAGRRLLRLLTLQGFLLPGFLLKDRTTVQSKDFHGRASAVFRYRRVLYEHEGSGTGFIAAYDRRRFFMELRRFLRAWWALRRALPTLQAQYVDELPRLTSESFWRQVYAAEAPRAPAASRPEAAVMPAPGDTAIS